LPARWLGRFWTEQAPVVTNSTIRILSPGRSFSENGRLRFHDGLDDFHNLLGDLPALGTGLRFFRMDSHGSIRQPLDYPQRDPTTPITANRTASIDNIPLQSLQPRSQAHFCLSQ
jgi:hypothetical protein